MFRLKKKLIFIDIFNIVPAWDRDNNDDGDDYATAEPGKYDLKMFNKVVIRLSYRKHPVSK